MRLYKSIFFKENEFIFKNENQAHLPHGKVVWTNNIDKPESGYIIILNGASIYFKKQLDFPNIYYHL